MSVCCVHRLNESQKTVIESREKIERQHQQLSDYEAELNLLRRRLETLESDRDKDKKTIATLQEALNRVRMVRIYLNTTRLRQPATHRPLTVLHTLNNEM